MLLTGLAVLAAAILAASPREPAPVDLAYTIDLSEAPGGTLVIALETTGDLPRLLDLAFPPGVFGDAGNGVTLHSARAEVPASAGRPSRTLPVERTGDGWQVATEGAAAVRLTYRVDLARVRGQEPDIRRHISTPVAGGVRAAGFEIFLTPAGLPVRDIVVSLHNPGELPVLVPWPTLLRGTARTAAAADSLAAAGPADTLAAAHLGAGQRYQPAGAPPAAAPAGPAAIAALSVPAGRSYHPRDVRDLANALLVCGDLRILATEVRDGVIQYATDRRWRFADTEALDLVARIARTQVGFFGSAPASPITVLLAANEVTAAEGFDVYGVHTGSSILVLVDPDLTWGELEEHAASVISHEMFHGWLGEAIPQSDPATLWFTEGATSWFAARMLTAAGIWRPEHARRVVASRVQRDYRESELLGTVAIADAAATVMGEPRQVRFAYAGGTAACMALDQWLASASGLVRPLDAVLRHLYATRDGTPLSRASLEAAVHEVTGVACGWWLDEHVYGKTALPPTDQVI
ncbi:MAG: M1 family aminopeptidase [Candidatus Krumholzibacteriia bacterium]